MQPTISVLMSFRTALPPPSIRSSRASSTTRPSRWWAPGAARATWSAATARSLESATTLRLERAGADDFEDLPIERSGEVYELAKQAQASIQGFRSGKPLVGRGGRCRCRVLAAEASANQGGRPIAVD
jgi:hypothetical protein